MIEGNCGENMSCVLENGKNEDSSCKGQDARVQSTAQHDGRGETIAECNQVVTFTHMILVVYTCTWLEIVPASTTNTII